ncbi:MAG: glutamate--cysteine ligase [Gammaproteobacteria bacterium]|nr:MAG: glutamate--cysteine ligase [Gammaproteobacteria bacterium]
MQDYFEDQLVALQNPDIYNTLPEMTRGLEKESLRIQSNGHLSQQDHPRCLGSALTHPAITTDYSEALLEFITPVFSNIDAPLTYLEDIHRYVYHCLDTEKLWVSSMPCIMDGEASIRIAEYGSSNIGKMKHVYRHGLWHRYGRLMQTIAGIHYNVSFPQSFWQQYQQACGDTQPLQDFISEKYFHIIRNFQRYVGMVVYLFGASPAVCPSFLQGREHSFETLNNNSLYAPFGTSLRMSNVGYSNDAQSGLHISYNSLNEYVSTLTHAIRTPYKPYQELGVKKGDTYQQLNANLLQIENEYYGNIRPKRTTERSERPTVALAKRGVEYIEMRCVDLDPFSPIGITPQQVRFLDVFALFCLLQPSNPITPEEQTCIDFNREAMVLRGRDPELLLRCGENSVRFHDWARDLLNKIADVASLFDESHQTSLYSEAVAAQLEKIRNPALTPSAQVLKILQEDKQSFFEFSMDMTLQHEQYFRSNPLSVNQLKAMQKVAQESHEAQKNIEASDDISFEQYLANYFSD